MVGAAFGRIPKKRYVYPFILYVKVPLSLTSARLFYGDKAMMVSLIDTMSLTLSQLTVFV